jgi:hypothetical protein
VNDTTAYVITDTPRAGHIDCFTPDDLHRQLRRMHMAEAVQSPPCLENGRGESWSGSGTIASALRCLDG